MNSVSSYTNRRQMHINAVKRNYDFAKTAQFRDDCADTVEERWNLLKISYVQFLEEHKALVEKWPADRMQQHDVIAEYIEQIYVQTSSCFRKRIAELKNMVKSADLPMKRAESPKRRVVLVQNSDEKDDVRADRKNGKANEKKVRSVVSKVPNKSQGDLRDRANTCRERNKLNCHLCGRSHPLAKCGRFIEKSIEGRKRTVDRLRLCRNCFAPKSKTQRHRCRAGPCKCGKYHNTLLCRYK